MQATELSAKELHLLSQINGDSSGQRNIAETAGFSLGLTNALLKRLVSKGFVKVVQLNGRSLRYFLTPAGFHEKLRRVHGYLTRSIRELKEFHFRLDALIKREVGNADFILLIGADEIANLTLELLESLNIEPIKFKDDHGLTVTLSDFPARSEILVLDCELHIDQESWSESLRDSGHVRVIRVVEAM